MRRHFVILTTFCFLLLAGSLIADSMPKMRSKGFVVLELFTSQGCSSCPPAERFFSRILKEAQDKNLAVYPLAFHVDYWNHLGWIDPFSRAEYTNRQNKYADIYKWKTIFTPQVILNGQYSLSGNDRDAVHKQLNKLLTTDSRMHLHIELQEIKGNRIKIAYSLDKFFDDMTINLALVEHGLSVEITSGENSGAKSVYDNVVRMFKSYPLKKQEGVLDLPLPSEVNLENATVIGYVQDSHMLFVYTADKAVLKN